MMTSRVKFCKILLSKINGLLSFSGDGPENDESRTDKILHIAL